jgi:TatD DNase family protein
MLIDFHTHHLTHNPGALELLNVFPNENPDGTFYSTGVHPWHLKDNNDFEVSVVTSRLSDARCIAIGETGLDRKIPTPLSLQREVFVRHLLLAGQFKKPVIVHCVGAHDQLLSVKKETSVAVPLIIHGYSKNERLAAQLLEAGFYLSFGIRLLESASLQKAFVDTPEDRFFLETDSFDVTIEEVYAKAAQLRKTGALQLQAQLKKNFNTVFGITVA